MNCRRPCSGLISDITERKMLEEQLDLARELEEENLKNFPDS